MVQPTLFSHGGYYKFHSSPGTFYLSVVPYWHTDGINRLRLCFRLVEPNKIQQACGSCNKTLCSWLVLLSRGRYDRLHIFRDTVQRFFFILRLAESNMVLRLHVSLGCSSDIDSFFRFLAHFFIALCSLLHKIYCASGSLQALTGGNRALTGKNVY